MEKEMAFRSLRVEPKEDLLRIVSLAMCNAERKHHMLSHIGRWECLTDEARDHYMRLAEAALSAIK